MLCYKSPFLAIYEVVKFVHDGEPVRREEGSIKIQNSPLFTQGSRQIFSLERNGLEPVERPEIMNDARLVLFQNDF